MRIIAVPLARAHPTAQPVATYLAQRLPSAASKVDRSSPVEPAVQGTAPSSHSNSESGAGADTKAEPLATRLLNKASNFWLALGRDGQDGKPLAILDWKRRTYNTGEKLMDRIEYEEWALKAIDPAMGPKLAVAERIRDKANDDRTQAGSDANSTAKQGKQASDIVKQPALSNISLLYPPSLLDPRVLLTSLTKLTSHRTPHHRTRMIYCIVGMPFTIPFALVPIVPNLPFFYLVWRAYSHWKAWKASAYLAEMLGAGRVEPTKSDVVDKVLNSRDDLALIEDGLVTGEAAEKVRQRQQQQQQQQQQSQGGQELGQPSAAEKRSSAMLLLNPARIAALRTALDLDQQSVIELKRALAQTELSVSRGQVEKLEKAAAAGGTSNDAAS